MPSITPLVFGSSPAITRLLDDAIVYASAPYPVLILGERGTGKTAIARHLHDLSRRPGEFIKTSAAAIAPQMEHSHLAGHVRGSFTGAIADRVGLFEAAHRGTFFLDELGAASEVVQTLLLGLLDDGALVRTGETRARPVNVRVVAATNADLEAMADAGRFRRDLRDRFGYLVLRMPPLSQRRAELLVLAEQLVGVESAAIGGQAKRDLTPGFKDCLMAASWPGNVRQLEQLCRFAVLHAQFDRPIGVEHLPPEFVASLGAMTCGKEDGLCSRVPAVLAETGGNKAAAARMLGISRPRLYRLIDQGAAAVDAAYNPPEDSLHLLP